MADSASTSNDSHSSDERITIGQSEDLLSPKKKVARLFHDTSSTSGIASSSSNFNHVSGIGTSTVVNSKADDDDITIPSDADSTTVLLLIHNELVLQTKEQNKILKKLAMTAERLVDAVEGNNRIAHNNMMCKVFSQNPNSQQSMRFFKNLEEQHDAVMTGTTNPAK
jgi:hypothetical protein